MAITTKESILKVLSAYNPWWKTGTVSPQMSKTYKRFAFHEAMKRLTDILFNLPLIVRVCGGSETTFLNQQPFFTVFVDCRILFSKRCFRNKPFSLLYLFIQLLGGSGIERNTFTVRVNNSCPIILNSFSYTSSVFRNYFLFSWHCDLLSLRRSNNTETEQLLMCPRFSVCHPSFFRLRLVCVFCYIFLESFFCKEDAAIWNVLNKGNSTRVSCGIKRC